MSDNLIRIAMIRNAIAECNAENQTLTDASISSRLPKDFGLCPEDGWRDIARETAPVEGVLSVTEPSDTASTEPTPSRDEIQISLVKASNALVESRARVRNLTDERRVRRAALAQSISIMQKGVGLYVSPDQLSKSFCAEQAELRALTAAGKIPAETPGRVGRSVVDLQAARWDNSPESFVRKQFQNGGFRRTGATNSRGVRKLPSTR
jgi:hypothetical protein